VVRGIIILVHATIVPDRAHGHRRLAPLGGEALQLTCVLSRRGTDYTGGESLLVEQRPRAQSRGDVIVPEQGEGLIFTTRHRPVSGSKGYYRAKLRHVVSRVLSGRRYSLGVIFHNAE